MEESFNTYRINDHFSETDLKFAHRELAQSYWAKNIPFETVKKAAENSICFNVFSGNEQVAFARVITDKTTYAYLCDVIVTETHRGKGIGKALMTFIMKHPDLQGLRRFTLGTKDAHGLYKQFGFTAPKFPERWMEINVRNIYER
ncbi:MAG TPA: GNAT family N-acetyltransferase [Bacteroidia bacterium]|nr:GNAT family N-acetyltransferase [Bacteroidia bacterium]